jgi:hypothetical protein
MGRIFTTLFEFRNEKHVAMVSVSEEQAGHTEFSVRLLNQELYQLIPEGTIHFSSLQDSLPDSVQNRLAAELFLSIKAAVWQYLFHPTSAQE